MHDRAQGGMMLDYIVKNMPDHLFEQLQERARTHRRSVNNEILVLIEQALQTEINERYDTQELLEEARKIRQHPEVLSARLAMYSLSSRG